MTDKILTGFRVKDGRKGRPWRSGARRCGDLVDDPNFVIALHIVGWIIKANIIRDESKSRL